MPFRSPSPLLAGLSQCLSVRRGRMRRCCLSIDKNLNLILFTTIHSHTHSRTHPTHTHTSAAQQSYLGSLWFLDAVQLGGALASLSLPLTHMLTLTYTHTHQHSAYSTQTPQAMRTFSALSFVALAFITHHVSGFISPAAPVLSHQRAAARASVVSVPSTASSPLCKPLYAAVADQP